MSAQVTNVMSAQDDPLMKALLEFHKGTHWDPPVRFCDVCKLLFPKLYEARYGDL